MSAPWRVKTQDAQMRAALAGRLKVSQILAQLLLNRGMEDAGLARDFLLADRKALLDPFLFRDMGAAVGRIRQAIAGNEKIMLYGDYDVDGITGTVLLHSILERLKASLMIYIPHRIREGYGLHDEPIRLAKEQGVGLMITIDCGTSESKRIREARRMGMDTIIVDHHEAKGELPDEALAFLNPKAPHETYPFRHLTSVGVAFKLACALVDAQSAAAYLDLVALGTVADVAPLVGENRVLVRQGLEAIAKTSNRGLRSLIQAASIRARRFTTDHLGFMLGPRINASGRMGSGMRAFRLLTTGDAHEADHLARELNEENLSRQKLERQVNQEAVERVEGRCDFSSERVLVVWGEGWHLGVVGIVASKLVERYQRPALVIGMEGERGRGSGRSIPQFDLLGSLDRCGSHLVRYGGHAQAVGLEISRDELVPFREAINREVRTRLSAEGLSFFTDIDMEIKLDALTKQTLNELEQLAPYGLNNPRPQFLSSELTVLSDPVPVGREGIRFWVEGEGAVGEGLVFKCQDSARGLKRGARVDLVYTPELDVWDGKEKLKLVVKDLKPCE